MKRRTALTLCFSAVLPPSRVRADDGLALLTPEQWVEEQRARQRGMAAVPLSRKRGLYPQIRVIAPLPDPAALLASPLRIELRFETSADARIVPSTFRVLYGLMKFDLTELFRSHARLSEQGLLVERAELPAGQHRLLLQIADNHGRVSEQELRLTVA